MASLAQQVGGLRCPSISTTRLSRKQHINTTTTPTLKSRKSRTIRMGFLKGVRVISNAQTKERERLREMFNDAYERCLREPSDGVAFSTDNFRAVIEKHGIEAEMGTTRVSSSPIFLNYLFWAEFCSSLNIGMKLLLGLFGDGLTLVIWGKFWQSFALGMELVMWLRWNGVWLFGGLVLWNCIMLVGLSCNNLFFC